MATPAPINCLFAAVKNPDEDIHLTIDFSKWFSPGDSLSTVTWSTADAEITIDSSEFTATEASVAASMAGAADNDTFFVKCLAVTRLGISEVRRVEIRVRIADYATRTERGWWRLD